VKSAITERARAQSLLDANLEQEMLLRQSDKLATLGKLSAGVAHELNNPAAAVQRGVVQLRKEVLKLENTQFELGLLQPNLIQMENLESCQEVIKVRSKEPLDIDSITRSDQEFEIQTWLEKNGIDNAWELAPTLVNISYNCPRLEEMANIFSTEQFPKVVALLCSKYNTYNLMEEIGHGAGRISEIVKSLKSYSYLDQGPLQSVDVHEGLDNTLVMLRSKLKKGITVTRNYDPDLPRIEAYGSELNQVWTNIIDNAASAMNGEGTIEIKTEFRNNKVLVSIKDDGPGISPEIQNQIFNPFFTTKAPGQGTGLGLNISYNIIVKKHHGDISVQSNANETCFNIEIPLYLKNDITKKSENQI
jgi:signal transduction histidine kinase